VTRVREPGLTREVVALAGPAVASGLVLMGYQWTNQYWVGRLDSTPAVAALSVATFSTWAFNALSSLVGVGLSALVARYVGAGRPGSAAWVASQGLRWAVALWALVAALGVAVAPWIFEEVGSSAEAARMGTSYVRLSFGLGVGTALQVACESVFRAHGDSRTPFVVSACGLVANAILDPILIWGWGPVPALGLPGSAVATAAATAGAAAVAVLLLRRRGFLSRVRPPDDELRLHAATPLRPGPLPGLDLSVVRRVARVGMPVAVSGAAFVAIYFFVSRVVNDAGGDAAQAGLGVGLRGEQVAFFLGNGFGLAAASLVGRRLGAGSPEGAARAAWRAALLCAVACAAWSLCLLAFSRPLAALFVPTPGAARDHAVAYFLVVSWCLVPQCFEVVLDGAFGGAGLTVPPMLISIAITVTRIPLARWAAFDLGLGVPGIWWTIAATAALRGVVVAVWFARGTWKTRTV
jgi:putative MATE family efflux protein